MCNYKNDNNSTFTYTINLKNLYEIDLQDYFLKNIENYKQEIKNQPTNKQIWEERIKEVKADLIKINYPVYPKYCGYKYIITDSINKQYNIILFSQTFAVNE